MGRDEGRVSGQGMVYGDMGRDEGSGDGIWDIYLGMVNGKKEWRDQGWYTGRYKGREGSGDGIWEDIRGGRDEGMVYGKR